MTGAVCPSQSADDRLRAERRGRGSTTWMFLAPISDWGAQLWPLGHLQLRSVGIDMNPRMS